MIYESAVSQIPGLRQMTVIHSNLPSIVNLLPYGSVQTVEDYTLV